MYARQPICFLSLAAAALQQGFITTSGDVLVILPVDLMIVAARRAQRRPPGFPPWRLCMRVTLVPRHSSFARAVRSVCRTALALAAAAVPAMAQGGSISGRITEMASGEPVTGATINASRSGGGGAGSVRSVANGVYTLANLPAGTYTVSVTARIGLSPRTRDSVVVRAGQTTTLDFAMAPIARQLEQVVTTATAGAEAERIQDSPNPIP